MVHPDLYKKADAAERSMALAVRAAFGTMRRLVTISALVRVLGLAQRGAGVDQALADATIAESMAYTRKLIEETAMAGSKLHGPSPRRGPKPSYLTF